MLIALMLLIVIAGTALGHWVSCLLGVNQPKEKDVALVRNRRHG
jgi:hypothetical protein